MMRSVSYTPKNKTFALRMEVKEQINKNVQK